ncbi:MAG TPA: zinc-binding dehydrogenase [Candidatus Sphingobacterium stercoripullorum]|nr:zinc-binding dehydrogenase [Candidatus Sphingobacterium stercoripullorum]
MKIKAAVLREVGAEPPYSISRPLRIEEIDLAPPSQDEVLVKIKAAGLCHSDLSVINGDRPRDVPIVLGHEACAEVMELGPGVKDFKVGDQVVLVFVPSCGSCPSCMASKHALCEPGGKANAKGTLLSGEKRLSKNKEFLNHHTGVSCFAEYAVVSVASCVKVPKSLSPRIAALFGCAILTGAGAVLNRTDIRAGDSAAVIGLGGVGFSSLLAAHAAGAEKLIVLDFDQNKLELAKELGATHVINPRGLTSQEVLDAIGSAVDYCYEMAGSAEAFAMAYYITKKGGTAVTSGLPNPNARFELPLADLVATEKNILGSYLGSGVPSLDIQRYIKLYERGMMPVDKLQGELFTLEEVNEGFDHMLTGANLRDAIVFD